MRALLCLTLKSAGFALGTARDGVEALKKIRAQAPDLVLLDLMLPELDGFAVCEILHGNPATSSIPVIMLTALSGEMARSSGLEAGARAYMRKPFSPRELIDRVREVLDAPQLEGAANPASSHNCH
jgi:two-component system, OmpR family, alkaline phosphatase synthesis response regulator PhoP